MRNKVLIPVLAGAFVFASAAFAQDVPVQIVSQADSPIKVTNAQCSSSSQQPGGRCKYTVQASQSGFWTAYGLVWKVTYENGRTTTISDFVDAFMSVGDTPGMLKPGESEDLQTGGFGTKGPDGKDLRVTNATVQVDFAVPLSDAVWGNSKSPNYTRMVAMRAGYAQAMNYLRAVYQKGGAEAALKALGVRK